MAENKVCMILDILSKEYNKGCYPGRNYEGLNPEWPPDPFHVLIATILSQRTKDDNTRKASDNLFRKYDSIDAIADADMDDVDLVFLQSEFQLSLAFLVLELVFQSFLAQQQERHHQSYQQQSHNQIEVDSL